MKKTVYTMMVVVLLVGLAGSLCGCELQQASSLLQVFNPDCFVSGGLTESEYDDLSSWEKLLYEENSCGLYVKHDIVEDIEDLF